ncbi:aldehyde dehydrogenase EutE [Clostridium sp. D2Q-14]|uniref:aldehyde dehydrogenase family protein n=1 Tax=Anaeromonas gelatinilytica TaxID=2683194 RepID=UPI00193B4C2D|nr:aldehyde dehydrogenase family protein [Anaeromonas gelatinilytica]MBS4534535.1 aldehyde dehydrogenase EutE [Anaeromonas gelatinilytica]
MSVETMDIEKIVNIVLEKINTEGYYEERKSSNNGVFSDMNMAIEAAYRAQKIFFEDYSLEDRSRIIQAMREDLMENVEILAKLGVNDTGMGRYEDKLVKNKLTIEKTPGVEDLKAEIYSGDLGLALIEFSPYGVIGAITPSTNPSETVICNSIGMIAAGNSVVFSPHPGAKNISMKTIGIINNSIKRAGGPENLVVTVDDPSIENAQKMMSHEKVKMIVATGGPGVVKSAMSKGKKAIGAGAGNPPALVDETADIEKAAKDIIDGCSFDNNLPCIAEKEVIVVESVADYLIFSMKKENVYYLDNKKDIDNLVNIVFDKQGNLNRKYVGKDAKFILNSAGIKCDEDVRVVIMEVERNHPFVLEELMMPILPIVRVKDIGEGINLAVSVEQGNRHTAVMHSKNIDNLTRFARKVETTIFVKNAPSFAGIGYGGEGYATFTIAGPTGEGLTSARSFARKRKCSLVGGFSIK